YNRRNHQAEQFYRYVWRDERAYELLPKEQSNAISSGLPTCQTGCQTAAPAWRSRAGDDRYTGQPRGARDSACSIVGAAERTAEPTAGCSRWCAGAGADQPV